MSSAARRVPAVLRNFQTPASTSVARYLSTTRSCAKASTLENPPKGRDPQNPSRQPPAPPPQEAENLKGSASASFLGTSKRLPEFNLTDNVVLVSGAARGLGLTQAEALLEAGATVYALDRLSEPSPDFYRVQKRAAEELGTTLYYKQIDVRDVEGLNKTIESIGDKHGRLDGLIAAAGIQQETTALEYTAKDANTMFEVNITGVFMTAQAAAKQMIKYGNGGSIAMIASMSATIANRVCSPAPSPQKYSPLTDNLATSGPHMSRVQRLQSRRRPARPQPRLGMGRIWHPCEHHLAGLHRNRHGRRTIPEVPRAAGRLASTEHARKTQQT